MANYQTVKLEKSLYQNGEGFVRRLEQMDPSHQYTGSDLAGLSAFERQLKRFDIHVSGRYSDRVEKFFSTSDSAVLFPAYLGQAVTQGIQGGAVLEQIIATRTNIDGMDYRSISSLPQEEDLELRPVLEGAVIPQTTIALQDKLVRLQKRGRMLVSSYEAIRFQKLDLFSVTLRQIGGTIAKSQLRDAIDVLINGDGNQNPATVIETAAAGTVTYQDLCALWAKFADYEMNVLLASPDMAAAILALPEFRGLGDGRAFEGPGSYNTPFGATLIKCGQVPVGTVIALDKNCALEMVSAGDVQVDYDKLIDCQLERVAITSITGFAKIFPGAVQVLRLKGAV